MRVPLEQIRAASEAASQRGVPVTAHLELIDADDAIRAGVAGIEHITSFGTTLAAPEHVRQFKQAVREDSAARRSWRPRLWQRIDLDNNPRLDPLLDLIVQRQTFISPTLAIFEAWPGVKDAMPEQVEAFENMMRFFSLCHKRGARIVVGSHAAAPFAAKGKAHRREIELMAEAGMSPLEIITAATKNNATFFGVHDRLGIIEAGRPDSRGRRSYSKHHGRRQHLPSHARWRLDRNERRRSDNDFSAQALTVNKVSGLPTGLFVRIKQTQRDETGATSLRYDAPRTGDPTKTNALAYAPAPNAKRRRNQYGHGGSLLISRLGRTFTTSQ